MKKSKKIATTHRKVGVREKVYSFNEVFGKVSQTREFRKIYSEELVRLRIAKQIRDLRSKTGLTQKIVAMRANMPQSVFARIESGTHSVSLDTLARVAHAFGKEVRIN